MLSKLWHRSSAYDRLRALSPSRRSYLALVAKGEVLISTESHALNSIESLAEAEWRLLPNPASSLSEHRNSIATIGLRQPFIDIEAFSHF